MALDEADKLLSLGFEAQLEAIRKAVGASDEVKKPVRPLVLAPNRLSKLGEGTRPRPQVCLFTATMPEAVEEAAAKWLHHPKRVCIRSDTGAAISPSITQVTNSSSLLPHGGRQSFCRK